MGGSAGMPRTTQGILELISRHNKSGGLQLVVINSCSPSKEINTKYKQPELWQPELIETKIPGPGDEVVPGATPNPQDGSISVFTDFGKQIRSDIRGSKRNAHLDDMLENLILRDKCYWEGRNNFCRIRKLIPWIGGDGKACNPQQTPIKPNPLLPFWEGKNAQFTRIDKEDRHTTHKFIGDLIMIERMNQQLTQERRIAQGQHQQAYAPVPSLFFETPEIFNALYTTAACDRRGTIMINLRKTLVGWFDQDWWNRHVQQWKNIHFAPHRLQGGNKRKKTRRKKKKYRKKRTRRRKKRTRRRRRKR